MRTNTVDETFFFSQDINNFYQQVNSNMYKQNKEVSCQIERVLKMSLKFAVEQPYIHLGTIIIDDGKGRNEVKTKILKKMNTQGF